MLAGAAIMFGGASLIFGVGWQEPVWLVLLAAAFAWLNPQSITLDLGFGVVETPVAYAVIACLAVGWILGFITSLPELTTFFAVFAEAKRRGETSDSSANPSRSKRRPVRRSQAPNSKTCSA